MRLSIANAQCRVAQVLAARSAVTLILWRACLEHLGLNRHQTGLPSLCEQLSLLAAEVSTVPDELPIPIDAALQEASKQPVSWNLQTTSVIDSVCRGQRCRNLYSSQKDAACSSQCRRLLTKLAKGFVSRINCQNAGASGVS